MMSCNAKATVLRPILYLLVLAWGRYGNSDGGGRILVFPEDGSHWINMEVILLDLHSRGHQITVVRSTESWYIPQNSPLYTSVTVHPAPPPAEGDVGSDFYIALMQRSLALRKMLPVRRFLEQQKDTAAMLTMFHGRALRVISAILDDSVLVAKLRESRFDLMFTDPTFPAGVLLAQYLSLPAVYNVRWLNAGEAHMIIAPTPPSYVPMYNSLLSDRMDMLQRTENFLRYLAIFAQERLVIVPIYAELLWRHFPPGADLFSMQRSADLWLMRVDFVFEFPRPTMPNVVYVGGFQCRPARPLPADLEAFVQSSGEHGVVVMSLGTLVSALPKEVTEVVAQAFAQLPHKVVWRFLGERPASLGNNTLLMDWLPQNDLLGHPKTRAFVAHGGTNGLYEAIYHGVPVLGLPLLFDQFDNVLRLQARGATRVLEAATLTTEDFLEALKDVLDNPSYRNSMQKLSRLHRDRPLAPLASAIFWIEFVIRNGGASHLRTDAYSLPWYSYYSLDVGVVLLVPCVALLWAFVFVCSRLCCRSSRRKTKQD